ncbi:rRNA-processing protein LAS1 [Rhodotorula paludigena]|uniref:rRNA-processing protein LAS1 n=1 Tax=Rhodotorula paludigena TaxID=86838 RepID=UPI00316CCC45
MLRPHRTPWATRAEFQLVFDRLFASDADPALQRDAVSRIHVWLARGNCPHAAESTASLVDLVLRDAAPSTSLASAHSEHDLRLAYAMAMIRFVNSLVDPLQTAYFARSIASLAAQIDLPLHFVELRHQATHEDLPRLAVLRDAARQALDWLYTHYWLPALSSHSSTAAGSFDPSLASSLPSLPLAPLRTHLLTTYKHLTKSSLRDASLAGRQKADLQRVYRDVERWVAENSLGGGPRGNAREEKARERALDGVAEVLWSEGGLVPLAKRKRPTARSPTLPPDLVALWTPLLSHLDATYDSLLSTCLLRQALDLVTSPTAAAADRSYVACVTAWVVELLKDAPLERDVEGEEEEEDDDEACTVKGVVKTCLLARTPAALALVDALLASRTSASSSDTEGAAASEALSARVAPLVQLARASLADSGFTQPLDAEAASQALDLAEAHLASLSHSSSLLPPAPTSSAARVVETMQSDHPASGAGRIRRVQGWKARPIGTLPRGGAGAAGVLALDLPPLPAGPVAVV